MTHPPFCPPRLHNTQLPPNPTHLVGVTVNTPSSEPPECASVKLASTTEWLPNRKLRSTVLPTSTLPKSMLGCSRDRYGNFPMPEICSSGQQQTGHKVNEVGKQVGGEQVRELADAGDLQQRVSAGGPRG